MAVMSRMDSLCGEVLALILKKLSIPDVVRARAVCRRWKKRVDAEKAQFQFTSGYCPLMFKRIEEQHTWCGYHSATGKWEPLPALSKVPRVIQLLPIVGSGTNGLLGFKIFSEFSGYIVGSPYSHKWSTLPRSADCWGDAAMFIASNAQGPGFRVLAVRDEDTHIYKSELDMWTKVGRTPQSVRDGHAVARIRNKICAAVSSRLYTSSADGVHLISFDMNTEKWTVDRIDIPVHHSAKESMQLAACAATLFAVTEDDDAGRVAVWGLGTGTQQFTFVAELLDAEIRAHLRPPAAVNAGGRARRGSLKLRSVGHGQRLFLWRQKSLNVVFYDLITREWRKLPELAKPDAAAAGDAPQITMDAGFFELKLPGLATHLDQPRLS